MKFQDLGGFKAIIKSGGLSTVEVIPHHAKDVLVELIAAFPFEGDRFDANAVDSLIDKIRIEQIPIAVQTLLKFSVAVAEDKDILVGYKLYTRDKDGSIHIH